MKLTCELERDTNPRTHTLTEIEKDKAPKRRSRRKPVSVCENKRRTDRKRIREDYNTLKSFPDRIFIELFPSTHKGYVYTKDYEHENGGCYYHSKENDNPVTGAFVSLYPDKHLTYLWNGVEKPLNCDWHEV